MKTFLIVLLVIVLAVFGIVFFAGNVVAAKAMEGILGVPVQVDRLAINKISSEVGIYGLKVGNPKGYREKWMATLPEIYVSYDLSGIFQKRMHVKQVRVHVDQVNVERQGMRLNLLDIPGLKSSKEKPAAVTKQTGAPAEPMTMQIDEVLITLGNARFTDATGIDKNFKLGINNMPLKNVTNPIQVVRQIVVLIVRKIGKLALTGELKDQFENLDMLTTAVARQALQLSGKGLDEVNALTKDLGNLTHTSGITNEASQAAESLKEGVSGLFDKMKATVDEVKN